MRMAEMCFFENLDVKKRPRSRIELHLHIESAFRASTILEIAKKKGIDLKVDSLEELKERLRIKRPGTLEDFLKPFSTILPIFIGDAEALERGAYEVCEDQAKQGILYFEARYAPHMCSNTRSTMLSHPVAEGSPEAFTPAQVVGSFQRGLRRGQEDFGIKNRTILMCIRGQPQWNDEVLSLCTEFAPEGVVGIDIAGYEDFSQEDIDVFKKASALGVRRTAHVGQAGPASGVRIALDEMEVERLGHGYRVVEDLDIYAEVLRRGIHLENCPHSSLLTGGVTLNTLKHPIVRFAEDGANFSISRDDPLITGTTLDDEYRMLGRMGLDHTHLTRANFNAARSCFLLDSEKEELVSQLCTIYGTQG